MIDYITIPNLEFIPNDSRFNDNHLFNCSTNSLSKFFPPEGFQNPKDVRGIVDITEYLANFKDYEAKFNEDMKEIDQFGNSNIYYGFMEDDLGIVYDTIEDKTLNPIRIMYRHNCDNLFRKIYPIYLDIFIDDLNSYMKEVLYKLYYYGNGANSARSFAKDEIKRMRLSVTALSKRLNKSIEKTLRLDGECTTILKEKIDVLIKYYRFILMVYEQYINDKIFVVQYIYNSLVDTLGEYYIREEIPFPIELCNMVKGVEEYRKKNGVVRL